MKTLEITMRVGKLVCLEYETKDDIGMYDDNWERQEYHTIMLDLQPQEVPEMLMKIKEYEGVDGLIIV